MFSREIGVDGSERLLRDVMMGRESCRKEEMVSGDLIVKLM